MNARRVNWIAALSALLFLPAFPPVLSGSEPPLITLFNPSSGVVGTGVTIKGENFVDVIAIKFNQTQTKDFSVLGGEIGVSVPAGATTGPITVLTASGSSTSAGIFLVSQTGIPEILGFSPQEGPPGTVLTISGERFAEITAVLFNGVPATAFTLLGSQISVAVPQKATTGPIEVVSASGKGVSSTSFQVTSVAPPAIDEFSPTSGPAGTLVTITGRNFVSVSSVKFGDVEANGFSAVGSQISVSVPAGAKSGLITITAPSGAGQSAANFFVTDVPPPSIVSFSPANGAPRTRVTITGTFFKDVTAVLFNGKASSFLVFGNQLFATVPDGATSGLISVSTRTGTSVSAEPFTVSSSAIPRIIEFSPTNGPAGTIVTIRGENLADINSVKIGGADASFSLAASPNITATVPQSAVTGIVEVRTPGGSATSAGLFHITSAAAPSITAFSPESGPPGGLVIVTGENFQGATSVKVGDLETTFLLFGSQIFITLPAEAKTGLITVVTPAGSGRSDRPFLIGSPEPAILEFNPKKGVAEDVITLVGSNLATVQSVFFGGAQAVILSLSSSEVQVKVPLLAKSGPLELKTAERSILTIQEFSVLPQIVRFLPASGTIGDVILIEGSGFNSVEKLQFASIAAAYEVISPAQIKATVPEQSVTGPIRIRTPSGEAVSASDFATIIPIPTEPPRIAFKLLESGKVELSWPNSNPAFLLQTTGELGSVWALESAQVLIVSGRRQVSLDTSLIEKRFFRLVTVP